MHCDSPLRLASHALCSLPPEPLSPPNYFADARGSNTSKLNPSTCCVSVRLLYLSAASSLRPRVSVCLSRRDRWSAGRSRGRSISPTHRCRISPPSPHSPSLPVMRSPSHPHYPQPTIQPTSSTRAPISQEQIRLIGPSTLGVIMLTASFVGMVFTIQFVREFARLGLTRSVGGVLSLAFSRELTPVIGSVIMAGRVGSAIAAELGTMAVSEQTDTLRVLQTDPVDYLITPRVIACVITMPVLSLVAFTVGMAASVLLADVVYGIPANVILESAVKALVPFDIIAMVIKSAVFAFSIAIISCGWGTTTSGGAKGVGESTTASVVLSLVRAPSRFSLLSLSFSLPFLPQDPSLSIKQSVRVLWPHQWTTISHHRT